MNNKPRLSPAIICIILAGISRQFLGLEETGPIALFFALVIASGSFAINWLVRETIARWGEWKKANNTEYQTITADTQRLTAAGKLTTEQISALNNASVRHILVPGAKDARSKRYIELLDRRIDEEFVYTFFAAGVGDYLPPIRTWGDGSRERLDADALTGYFIEQHYAEPAKGPKPARWVNRPGAIVKIEVDET